MSRKGPILDWSAYREAGMGDAYADIPKEGSDFARAVAVCINSRHCETDGAGVMCPSFRVTHDPNLSTGGRVRLLKAVLNDELPLDDPELAEAMALCVACKGCKRECENGVDMAQIKTEYLARRAESKSVPLRSRLFAGLPRLLQRYPLLAGMIAVRNRSKLLSGAGEKLLGIAADRPLPLPAAQPFDESVASLKAGEAAKSGEVVLFIDSFNRHFAPGVITAAIEVLQRAGYRVHLPAVDIEESPLCCGRSSLANGLVDAARREARQVVAALFPYAERGVPVIGLEPACLLAIRDDYRALGLGEAAETVAGQAVLFEEFVARETTAGRMQLEFEAADEDTPPLLVHGHCHQKAVGAMKSMRKVLKQLPGLKFEMIEASCCGMAGGFGLEAEHADISRKMAEAALLPALREKPDAEVVANGFSCREQIHDQAGRESMHLAVLLQRQLKQGIKESEGV